MPHDVHRRSLASHGPSEWRHGSFRQGLAVNLLNPSIATFYLVVVPIVSARRVRHGGILPCSRSIHIRWRSSCHGLWALALARLRRLLPAAAGASVARSRDWDRVLALALRVLLPVAAPARAQRCDGMDRSSDRSTNDRESAGRHGLRLFEAGSTEYV